MDHKLALEAASNWSYIWYKVLWAWKHKIVCRRLNSRSGWRKFSSSFYTASYWVSAPFDVEIWARLVCSFSTFLLFYHVRLECDGSLLRNLSDLLRQIVVGAAIGSFFCQKIFQVLKFFPSLLHWLLHWLSIAESIRFAAADCGRCCDRELFLSENFSSSKTLTLSVLPALPLHSYDLFTSCSCMLLFGNTESRYENNLVSSIL